MKFINPITEPKGFVLLLFLVCLFARCANPEPIVELSDSGYQKSLEPILETNDLETQRFDIDSESDTTLVGKKGTIIRIPANAFKPKSGSKVKIELIEAPTIQDMLLLNSQTMSDGKLLETGGVLYLQAKDNDEVLKPSLDLEIKIPSNNVDRNMNAYVGEFDENGVMNWTEGNQMSFDSSEAFNKLVSNGMFEIPFDLFPYRAEYYRMDSIADLYPPKNGIVKAPLREYLVAPEKKRFYDKLITMIETDQFKGTHLATREFAERLYRLQYVDHTYSYEEPRQDGLFEMSEDRFATYQHSSLQIYIDNVDKPLWYSDSLVFKNISNYIPRNTGSDTYEQYKVRCDKQKTYFENFYKEKMTELITIEDNGVDLESEDAVNQLIQKGVKPEEARNTKSLYEQQQEVIENLKSDEDAFIESLARKEQYLK